jgi:hypothetical protein
MHNKIVLLALAFLSSACSHLAVTIPTPIVEAPEISGQESFHLGARGNLQSGHRYEATGDASSRPPTLTSPTTNHVLSTLGGVYGDFAKRIRFGLNGDPINGGLFGQAQIQLLGEGRSTAKRGNFSLSVFGHAGKHTPDKDGDQSSTFGPGGNPWKAEIDTDWYDFGASIGFRVSDASTLFVGAAKQLTLYRTKIDHTQGAAPNAIYQTHDRAEANKALAGVSFSGERGQLFVAADYTDIRYQRAPKLFVATATLGVEIDFR